MTTVASDGMDGCGVGAGAAKLRGERSLRSFLLSSRVYGRANGCGKVNVVESAAQTCEAMELVDSATQTGDLDFRDFRLP